MGRAQARRAPRAALLAAVVAAALTGCIPAPPPVPQPTSAAPIAQGEAAAGEVREGFVRDGGPTTVALRIDERAAVVIGAASPDDEDLTLRLTSTSAEIENDDGHGEVDVFDFAMQSRDPVLATVLEPGDYTIEIGEWSGASSDFQLQVLTSTTVVPAGTGIDAEFGPGRPALAIVPLATGDETIAVTSDVDTTLWVHLPESGDERTDDDSGGDRNPRIELAGEVPQDAVVIATGYARDDTGSLRLTVD